MELVAIAVPESFRGNLHLTEHAVSLAMLLIQPKQPITLLRIAVHLESVRSNIGIIAPNEGHLERTGLIGI